MKLYFGNTVTTITTLMIIIFISSSVFIVFHSASIHTWGRIILLLLIFGLVLCCFAATRDGLDKTIANKIDKTTAPGIFPLISAPTIISSASALVIVICAILTPFLKAQSARKVLYFMISSSMAIKILTIEIARIIMRYAI